MMIIDFSLSKDTLSPVEGYLGDVVVSVSDIPEESSEITLPLNLRDGTLFGKVFHSNTSKQVMCSN